MFQLYNSITHHLCIVLCVYHPSQVSFLHIYLSLTLFYVPLPSVSHHAVVYVHESFFYSLLSPFTLLPQP